MLYLSMLYIHVFKMCNKYLTIKSKRKKNHINTVKYCFYSPFYPPCCCDRSASIFHLSHGCTLGVRMYTYELCPWTRPDFNSKSLSIQFNLAPSRHSNFQLVYLFCKDGMGFVTFGVVFECLSRSKFN